jgi:hypothetical protein
MKPDELELFFKSLLKVRTKAGVEDLTYKEVKAMKTLPPFPEHDAAQECDNVSVSIL